MLSRARRPVVLVLGGLALVAAFLAPVWARLSLWGIADWDLHLSFHEVPRLTVAAYRQIPLWNPYACGGMPLLAHPESRFLTPFFGLYLLLGPVVGAKIDLALHLFVALAGAFVLARRLGQDDVEAALSASLFSLSGMFAINLATGDYISSAAYIPWALWFAVRGLSRPADRVGCALTLALIFGEGGAYILPITVLTLGIYSAALAARRRSWRPVAGLLAVGALAAGLSAVKLLPAAELLPHHRPNQEFSGFSVQSLWDGLTSREQRFSSGSRGDETTGFWKGRSWGLDENGTYVGAVPLALGLYGLAAAEPGYHALRAAFAALLWLSFGDRARPSLWRLLHRLPGFHAMRIATRLRMAWVLLLALFAGAGLKVLRRRLRSRSPRLASRTAAAALLALVLADLGAVTRPIWREAFTWTPAPYARSVGFFQSATRPRSQLRAAFANVGVVGCYREGFRFPEAVRGIEEPGYRGEAWLDGTSGRASYAEWTPNRLTLDVEPAGPGTLVVNQNYWRGWSAEDGRPVLSHAGLLSVPLAAGDRRVVLSYRPWSFLIGAAITLLTLAGLAAWAAARALRRRQRRLAAATSSPIDASSVPSK